MSLYLLSHFTVFYAVMLICCGVEMADGMQVLNLHTSCYVLVFHSHGKESKISDGAVDVLFTCGWRMHCYLC